MTLLLYPKTASTKNQARGLCFYLDRRPNSPPSWAPAVFGPAPTAADAAAIAAEGAALVGCRAPRLRFSIGWALPTLCGLDRTY